MALITKLLISLTILLSINIGSSKKNKSKLKLCIVYVYNAVSWLASDFTTSLYQSSSLSAATNYEEDNRTFRWLKKN